jgi:hypothetical protein
MTNFLRNGERHGHCRSIALSLGNSAKTGDVVATIFRVKRLAAEVIGLKKMKALIEALEE